MACGARRAMRRLLISSVVLPTLSDFSLRGSWCRGVAVSVKLPSCWLVPLLSVFLAAIVVSRYFMPYEQKAFVVPSCTPKKAPVVGTVTIGRTVTGSDVSFPSAQHRRRDAPNGHRHRPRHRSAAPGEAWSSPLDTTAREGRLRRRKAQRPVRRDSPKPHTEVSSSREHDSSDIIPSITATKPHMEAPSLPAPGERAGSVIDKGIVVVRSERGVAAESRGGVSSHRREKGVDVQRAGINGADTPPLEPNGAVITVGAPGATTHDAPSGQKSNAAESQPRMTDTADKDTDGDSAGFGEHGWYSTYIAEDGVGSVFSWGEDGDPASGEQAVADTAELGASQQDESEHSQDSGNREKELGGKEDNSHWSERRRLVEEWEKYDEVWISMREEAKAAAEKEPLLVSFVYSTILNQRTLEAAVAFHLANKLAGPHMLSTQVQALVREYFADVGTPVGRHLRRDIIAVRERDPACDSYHDCLMYFKGFQALQTHRVAHWLYHSGRHALAFYLQSQVNQEFQIDIHPAAKFGEGVFIDHGTGIVVGETAVVGDDVSMLHRVTLGGSGVKSSDRHPKIGNGVLIGAGACLLGNISIGKGTQIGAGSLVVTDLPERCVAVGVPAKVLGQGRKREPALAMGQDFFKEVWKGQDI